MQYFQYRTILRNRVHFPHLPPEAAVAIGSFVGFYGVDQTKALILDKISAFMGKKQPENNQHDDTI